MSKSAAVKREAFSRPLAGGEKSAGTKVWEFHGIGHDLLGPDNIT